MSTEDFDPFSDETEENETDADEDQGSTPQESSVIKEFRKRERSKDRKLREYEKELEELRTFRQSYETERKEQEVKGLFESLDLNPKHIPLFQAVHKDEELTEDAVKRFALEYELVTASEEGGQEPSFTPPPDESRNAPFAPVGKPESSQESFGRVLTREEMLELATTNPAKYEELKKRGRIKPNKLPGARS